MARQLGHVSKQLQRCIRGLDSFTDGQVALKDCDWDNLTYVSFEVAPNGGLYEGGTFYFKVTFPIDYPQKAPSITCKTSIYHPNIDSNGVEGNVCVNLLSEWTPSHTLEDVIQAVLFLMYNPNVEDPLSELISSETPIERFERNAKAIYQEGKNPLYKSDKGDEENDEEEEEYYDEYNMEEDFFKEAVDLYNEKTREEWKSMSIAKTVEWDKRMQDEKFTEKINRWEEEEKIRVEEEEKQRKEEEERKEQERLDEERRVAQEGTRQEVQNSPGGSQEEENFAEAVEETMPVAAADAVQHSAEMLPENQEDAREEEPKSEAALIDPPEIQFYIFCHKIIRSFAAMMRTVLSCVRTKVIEDHAPGVEATENESIPLVPCEQPSCLTGSQSANEQIADCFREDCSDKTDNTEVSHHRRRESNCECVPPNTDCRPQYKRCISC